jgi:hypothetical protein
VPPCEGSGSSGGDPASTKYMPRPSSHTTNAATQRPPRSGPGRKPGRGGPSCTDVQGHGDDRRSRRRQNHHRQHPAVIIPVLIQHTPCCSGTCSIPASHAARSGRTGRTEEGGGHRGAQLVGAEAVVEAQRVATTKTACLTTVRHGELSQGRRGLLLQDPRSSRCGQACWRTRSPARCGVTLAASIQVEPATFPVP